MKSVTLGGAMIAVLAVAMGAGLLAAPGCSTWEALWGNVKGPVSGKIMSPEEARAEVERENQRAAAEAKAKIETELAAARARKADFELAAARLSSNCELELRGLANKYDQDEAVGKAALASIDGWLADKTSANDAALTRTLSKYEQDRGAIGAIVDAVTGPLSALPWGGTALAGLLAVTGFRRAGEEKAKAADEKSKATEAERIAAQVREQMALQQASLQKQIREEADKAWDAAKAEEKENQAVRDAHFDMGAREAVVNTLTGAGLKLVGVPGAAPAAVVSASAPVAGAA